MQACDARWPSRFTAELRQTGTFPPCVTSLQRERLLTMQLKNTGNLRRKTTRSPMRNATRQPKQPGRSPTMAVPRPRQPKRTNPKHDVEAQGARDMFRASSAVNQKKAREALRACTHKPSGPSFGSVRGLFEPGTCPARPREAYSLKRYPTPRTVSMWLEIWGPSLARMRLTWTSTVREPPQ